VAFLVARLAVAVYESYTVRGAGMPRIEYLDIDDHILEKIEVKHGVSWDEIVEACSSSRAKVKRTRSGLFKVYGRRMLGAIYSLSWRNIPDRCGSSLLRAT
jgi:hypothetical protein